MRNSVVLSIILAVSALLGCSQPLSPPACRTSVDDITSSTERSVCLIKQSDFVVLMQKPDGLLTTMSVEQGTVCELHNQVWRMTGINTAITDRLYNSPSLDVFACVLPQDMTIPEQGLALPEWRENHAANKLVLVKPFELSRLDLARPDWLIPLREAYVKE